MLDLSQSMDILQATESTLMERPPDPQLFPGVLTILRQGIGLATDLYDLAVINAVRPELEACYGKFSDQTNGLITSASHAGSIVGQLSFGYIADRTGRRNAFIVTALLMGVSALGAATAFPIGGLDVPQVMIIWRFLLGVGIGGEYPLCGAVTAEHASSKQSGFHLACVLLCFLWGQLLSPVVVLFCLYADLPPEVTWRLAIGVGALLAFFGAALRLRTMQETAEWLESRDFQRSVRLLSPDTLRAIGRPLAGTCSAWFLYDVISYGAGGYTSLIFKGNTRVETTWFLLVIVLLSAPGYFFTLFVGRFGRRNFQAVGYMGMAVLMLLVSFLYGRGAPDAVLVVIFGLQKTFDAFGPGAMTFMIPAEIFPTALRATSHGLSAAGGKVGAVLGTSLLPQYRDLVGTPGVLATMGALSLLGVVVTWKLIPPYDARTLARLRIETRWSVAQTSQVLWNYDSGGGDSKQGIRGQTT